MGDKEQAPFIDARVLTLLITGPSGVRKTTVAAEVSACFTYPGTYTGGCRCSLARAFILCYNLSQKRQAAQEARPCPKRPKTALVANARLRQSRVGTVSIALHMFWHSNICHQAWIGDRCQRLPIWAGELPRSGGQSLGRHPWADPSASYVPTPPCASVAASLIGHRPRLA